MPPLRRYHSYPWPVQAQWLHDSLPEMIFTLNEKHNTIATVWMEESEEWDDQKGDDIMRMGTILEECFGAYLCGPMTNAHFKGHPAHQSFGFWNQPLLDHATRVLPLPEGLQPGRIIYSDPLDEQAWANLDRYYNKLPGELPPPSCTLPDED